MRPRQHPGIKKRCRSLIFTFLPKWSHSFILNHFCAVTSAITTTVIISFCFFVAANASNWNIVLQEKQKIPKDLSATLHPEYKMLIKEYPFQPVQNQKGEYVNIILVRSPFRTEKQEKLFEMYRDEILFIGICSFEDFPLPPQNPFSRKFPRDKYVGMFPAFLHMFRNPEEIFPSHVKLLLMSQSDFALPSPDSKEYEKKYDFIFSGTDQDVAKDCVGWSSYAKNWTFALEALEVMCGEFELTGVLVATKDKQGKKACHIPDSCKDKMIQTKFLNQNEFFNYMKQSRFTFFPQIHDASPRVTTQSLANNVPLFMNGNIMGGWKYVNSQTGVFFHDMSNFRSSLKEMMEKLDSFQPREYVNQYYGDSISGKRLKKFIDDNFSHRILFPTGTTEIYPRGA